MSKDNQILEVGLNEELVALFSRALEVAEADKISAQQYLSGIVLHIIGMILSISKNKIFEIGDVDQKIEQAKIIMNENVFKNIDPEELALKLNISYSWSVSYYTSDAADDLLCLDLGGGRGIEKTPNERADSSCRRQAEHSMYRQND